MTEILNPSHLMLNGICKCMPFWLSKPGIREYLRASWPPPNTELSEIIIKDRLQDRLQNVIPFVDNYSQLPWPTQDEWGAAAMQCTPGGLLATESFASVLQGILGSYMHTQVHISICTYMCI